MTWINFSSILQGFWPLILSIFGVVWWLARLESRTQANAAKIVDLEKERNVVYETRDLARDINAKLEVLVPNYYKK